MTAISPSSEVAVLEAALARRNAASAPFFARYAEALARASREMADRFARGGRLLAFGDGPHSTDAQHVEVEFVHPVLVGKSALPALDLSVSYRQSLRGLLRPDDIVMAFGPPEGDPQLDALVAWAGDAGAQTLSLPGTRGAFAAEPCTIDPFVHQELVEILYHTLWETVHVFLEHRRQAHDAGAASFLYPFLGDGGGTESLIAEVAASICAKAATDERLRLRMAREQGDAIVRAVHAIDERLRRGGTLVLFGNGGSATDANDWALDCLASPKGHAPIPAVSLAASAATLSALANDIGPAELFLRQLMAQARPGDVAIAISTSGGSPNVVAALEHARRNGLLTVALLGHDGGEIARRGAADHAIVVHCDYVPRVQEVQASVYHVMLDLLAAVRASDVP